jgi:CheY-like chemotaxis protein
MGLQVDLAANGREAVAAASNQAYDLLFMDCRMPEMDGFEATAHLRRHEEGGARRLPIVALTAQAMEGERERCLGAGMDDYATKPLHLPEIERILDRFLGAPLGAALDAEVLAQLERVARPEGSFLEELVSLFRRDLPARLEALATALAEGRSIEGAGLAHSLRGALGTLGAKAAAALGGQLEQLLREDRTEEARAFGSRFEEAVREAMTALEAHLTQGRPGSFT